MKNGNDKVLLGGADAEMMHIRKKLDENGILYEDANLGWGANIDSYKDIVLSLLEEGKTPVAIELVGANNIEGVVDIDHHNDRSNEPAAILQVMERFGLKVNFFDKLIAANDSGFIYAMQDLLNSDEFEEKLEGKSKLEKEKIKSNLIARVRKLDRNAQGITDEQEGIAETAILNKEELNNGNLTIVRLKHSKGSTVTDRLFGQYMNLLIISGDGESNFYGDGELCKKLNEMHDGSWSGGEGLGKKGGNAFFGGYVDQKQLEEFVINNIK